MSEKLINVTLKVWRQKSANAKGYFETYKMEGVSTASSFLEMLDLLNQLESGEGEEDSPAPKPGKPPSGGAG